MSRKYFAKSSAAAASLLAWPAAYLAVHKFLAGYPYRISPSFLVFLSGSAAIIVLIMITNGLHAFQAARTDPAITLRSE